MTVNVTMGRAVRVLLAVAVLLFVAVVIWSNETLLTAALSGIQMVGAGLVTGVLMVAGWVLGVYLLKRPIAFLALYVLRRPISNLIAQWRSEVDRTTAPPVAGTGRGDGNR